MVRVGPPPQLRARKQPSRGSVRAGSLSGYLAAIPGILSRWGEHPAFPGPGIGLPNQGMQLSTKPGQCEPLSALPDQPDPRTVAFITPEDGATLSQAQAADCVETVPLARFCPH